MLVMTRRIGESIMIGDSIKITFLGRYNNQIKVGIEAPHDIDIHREEVYLKILKDLMDGKEKKKKAQEEQKIESKLMIIKEERKDE